MTTPGSKLRVMPLIAASMLLLGAACSGSEQPKTTQAWNEDDDDSGAPATESDSDPSMGTAPEDTGDPVPCDDVCESPPSDCQLAPGTCAMGSCSYPAALAGTPCTGGCATTGFCDADGGCICSEGACADTCVGGPNMTAACNEGGQCIRTCTAPYDDCDGDPANGCEVPVGIAHQCDVNGINADGGGCWTAYCGEAQGDGVFNFGSFHCVDCSTCGTTDGGQCHWCNHDSGTWFPAEACECGGYLDAVCGPA